MIDFDKADIKQWVDKMLDGKKIYKKLVNEIRKTLPKLKNVKCEEQDNLMSSKLGIFTFDSENKWFTHDYNFEENEVVLNLLTNNRVKAEEMLSMFEKIMSHISEVEIIARGYAINQLIEMNEDLFFNNENGALIFEALTEKMTLESIGIYENESISFWYYYEKSESDGRVIMIKFTIDELLGKLSILGLN